MRTVAVLGAAGGSGVTTVAAHLAAGLHAAHKHALAFDFSPDNVLRLHFGMAWQDTSGFAPALLADGDWHAATYRSATGLDFVPFGQLASDAELDRLASFFTAEPLWLRKQLQQLALPSETVAVCDCPRAPGALTAQALAAADLALLVMAPDAVAYAVATRTIERIRALGGPPAALLLNGFDPARRFDRDIAVLLRTAFQDRLAPVTIHRDAFLNEALACKQTVFDFAPSSQAAHEFAALSTWVLARLAREES